MSPESPTPVVEMKNCSFAPWSQGYGLWRADFAIGPGEVAAIRSDTNEDAHLFLRCLASLEKPLTGEVFYKERLLDFGDYRRLLYYKKKVGYIASDTAVFSNRTLGESLLFSDHYFFESSLKVPDPETRELARWLEILDRLYLKPHQAYVEDIRLTVIVRELMKKPEILLIERPSEDLDRPSELQFLELIEKKANEGVPMVLYTFNRELMRKVATKTVHIRQGSLRVTEGVDGA